jgi:alpha-glucoside transport system substrate-binding protein
MLAPFEAQTGIKVNYEATRDLNAVLTTRVQGGNPPDVAGLPGPGQLLQFAKIGALKALDNVLSMDRVKKEYDPGWLELATYNGKIYGVFTKAAVKSLIWYDPKHFNAAGYKIPTTWDELLSLSDQIAKAGNPPWAIGLESGAASGWSGTDWIEDIMLRTAGPQKYDQWVKHTLPWTSPEVKNAWETWGKIVNNPDFVYGGKEYVLSTNFGDAVKPVFSTPPGAYLHRQANYITSFIQSAFPDAKAGVDFDTFVFPPIDSQFGNPIEVAGDLFGMFNDTPQSRALIDYLTTAPAQEIWARRGGYLAPNKNVPSSVYPDKLTQKTADILAKASVVRFDASDQMPDAVNTTFWSGIMDFVNDPTQLDNILQNLENTAKTAYATP